MTEKWTEQKVFNKCAKHMLFGENWCRNDYIKIDSESRTFKTCAVGNLPSMQSQISEAKDILDHSYNSNYYPELSKAQNSCRPELICDIIEVNDHAKRSRFGEKMRAIARKYNLKIPDFLLKENLGR